MELQSAAAQVMAELHAESPDDQRCTRILGGISYDLAGLCHRAGDASAAIRALDTGERLYAALADRAPAAAGQLADVRVRRGLIHAGQGHGASALADVQAVFHPWSRPGGSCRRGGSCQQEGARPPDPPAVPDGPDGARVLALASDVLAAFGDPDLALVAADLAIRAGLGTLTPGGTAAPAIISSHPAHPGHLTHPGYLARACRVAAVIRQARGPAEADRAERLAAAAAHLGVPPAVTVVERRLATRNPPDLALGLAGALRAARRHGDRHAADHLLETVIEPWAGEANQPASPALAPARIPAPTWHSRITALDPAGPAGPARDARAAGHAAVLARLAGDVLPADPSAGMRLVLEAHSLRTAAPRAGLRGLAAVSTDSDWAGLLLTASRQAAAAQDPELAADLAVWAARPAAARTAPEAGGRVAIGGRVGADRRPETPGQGTPRHPTHAPARAEAWWALPC
ncbi:hypothetical protein [Parafrankia sp. CH37]|uniref:hypothetical protein n=1 Tax=Parafrankia sp. CH37 TaxID=683308 RepID=UPI001D02CDDF|nr:hypothetical protein [Parafrankia sp. CH37]